MSTNCFVYENHTSDKLNMRPQTGILLFLNKVSGIWHSKRQNGVEASTFSSESISLRNDVKLIKALR